MLAMRVALVDCDKKEQITSDHEKKAKCGLTS